MISILTQKCGDFIESELIRISG